MGSVAATVIGYLMYICKQRLTIANEKTILSAVQLIVIFGCNIGIPYYDKIIK